jgi:hypothetical protein
MTESVLPQVERENGVFEVVIAAGNLSISKEAMGRSLGYPDCRIDSHFEYLIEQVLIRVPELCRIRAGYRVVDARTDEGRNDGFFANDIFFQTDRIVAAQLKKAEKVALFACTIGPGMESWSRQTFRDGDPVSGHFIDTAASVAVEKATEILHDHIGSVMAQRGLHITNRFSPGYCGWSVAEQYRLFSFFHEGFCGISLTDSALMLPIKSVSGIIGIGALVNREDYFCDRCTRKECTYRAYKASPTIKRGQS